VRDTRRPARLRWDLSQVHLLDERSGQLLCRRYPQDKQRNASGMRAPLEPLANSPTAAEPSATFPPERLYRAGYRASRGSGGKGAKDGLEPRQIDCVHSGAQRFDRIYPAVFTSFQIPQVILVVWAPQTR